MTDEIVRTALRGHPVRVVAVTTTEVTREAARRHQAGQAGALALGRGLTAGLLLATLTKDEERVSLQVLGDGPLGGLTIDAGSAGTARGYVKNPHVPLPAASARGRRPPQPGGGRGAHRPGERRPRSRAARELPRPDRARQRRDRRGRRALPARERADRQRDRLRRDRRRGRRGGVRRRDPAAGAAGHRRRRHRRRRRRGAARGRAPAHPGAAAGERGRDHRGGAGRPIRRDPAARSPAGPLPLSLLAPARGDVARAPGERRAVAR